MLIEGIDISCVMLNGNVMLPLEHLALAIRKSKEAGRKEAEDKANDGIIAGRKLAEYLGVGYQVLQRMRKNPDKPKYKNPNFIRSPKIQMYASDAKELRDRLRGII